MTSRDKAGGRGQLWQVVPPSRNDRGPGAVSQLLQGLPLEEPLSLEVCVEPRRRAFYIWTPGELVPPLRSAYEQSLLTKAEAIDPARPAQGAVQAQAELRLARPAALPLVLPARPGGPVRSDALEEADPLLGVLALGEQMDEGESLLSQLVIKRASYRWAEGLRAGISREEEREEAWGRQVLAQYATAFAFLGLVLAGFLGYRFYSQGSRLALYGLAAGYVAYYALIMAVLTLFARRAQLPPDLVKAKIAYPAFRARLLLTARAPSRARARQLLAVGVAAYQQFSSGANSLKPMRASFDPQDRAALRPRRRLILNALEVALLYHLPAGEAPVSFLERSGYRRLLPARMEAFSHPGGCLVGFTDHPERRLPIYLDGDALNSHIAVIGGTGTGKSTLMTLLACHLMEWQGPERVGLLVVDPHGPLVEGLLGLVPRSRLAGGEVVYLDLASERPLGWNLLDPQSPYPDDLVVDSIADVVQRFEADRWIPRVIDTLKNACLALRIAGRKEGYPYTILDVDVLGTSERFRRHVCRRLMEANAHPKLIHYWSYEWPRLTKGEWEATYRPIRTRVARFDSGAMGNLVGSRTTTFHLGDLFQKRAILLVNCCRDRIGEENSRVLRGLLLSYLNIEARRYPRSDSPRAYCFLDEFHSIPFGNVADLANELRKFGVRLVVATQALGLLAKETRTGLLPNLDLSFWSRQSPEDARLAVAFLGPDLLTESDVQGISRLHWYVKARAGHGYEPPFSLENLPRPYGEAPIAQEIIASTGERWGRDRWVVEWERREVAQKFLGAAIPSAEEAPAREGSKPPLPPFTPPQPLEGEEKRSRRAGAREARGSSAQSRKGE